MIRRRELGRDRQPQRRTRLHTATLLPTGKVLVAGGIDGSSSLSSAELYDPGLGFDPSWQPLLTAVSPSFLPNGSALTASGSRFKGISEASGGNGAQNSSSNYPLVQLLSLANEQTLFLPVDAMTGWSDTSFTSTPITLMTTSSADSPLVTRSLPSLPTASPANRSSYSPRHQRRRLLQHLPLQRRLRPHLRPHRPQQPLTPQRLQLPLHLLRRQHSPLLPQLHLLRRLQQLPRPPTRRLQPLQLLPQQRRHRRLHPAMGLPSRTRRLSLSTIGQLLELPHPLRLIHRISSSPVCLARLQK